MKPLLLVLLAVSLRADIMYQNFDDDQANGINGQHWGFGRSISMSGHWAGTFVADADARFDAARIAVAALNSLSMSQYLIVNLMSDGGLGPAYPSGTGNIPGTVLDTLAQQAPLSMDVGLVQFDCAVCPQLLAGARYWISAQFAPFTVDPTKPTQYPWALWAASWTDSDPFAAYGFTFGQQWVSENVDTGAVAFAVLGSQASGAQRQPGSPAPSAVPEPASGLLFGTIMAGWLICRHRTSAPGRSYEKN